MTQRRILVLGAHGQVGKALVQLLGPEQGVGASRAEADLANPSRLLSYLNEMNPTALINAAAYTQVDRAETEAELAEQVNGRTPGELALWARTKQIPLIHFSTDYVFPGNGNKQWKEEDTVSPLNQYGKTKLLGEQNIAQAGGDYLIFRTSWVYDGFGKNFLTTMLKLGKERESLTIVDDQIGAPTYATDLATGALEALHQATEMATQIKAFPSGVFHLCNQGETSWYHFAQAIFRQAQEKGISLKVQKATPIASSQFPTPAARPKNSRLSNEKVFNIFGVSLPPWESGLKRCMETIL